MYYLQQQVELFRDQNILWISGKFGSRLYSCIVERKQGDDSIPNLEIQQQIF